MQITTSSFEATALFAAPPQRASNRRRIETEEHAAALSLSASACIGIGAMSEQGAHSDYLGAPSRAV